MREEFYRVEHDFATHRRMLWHALEMTCGDVVECGMGHGSTSILHTYCINKGRMLYSYEASQEWVGEFSHLIGDAHIITHVTSWDDTPPQGRYAVALVDHDASLRRGEDAIRLGSMCDIVVLHDVEPWNDMLYGASKALRHFKYVSIDTAKMFDHVFWTAMLSNTIDVSRVKV